MFLRAFLIIGVGMQPRCERFFSFMVATDEVTASIATPERLALQIRPVRVNFTAIGQSGIHINPAPATVN